MRFLDNVLQDFIDRAPDEMARAKLLRRCASARSGLGVMGFHSFLQAQNVPFESAHGEGVEHEDVQAHPRARPTRRRVTLAQERGACPDAAECGVDGALLATRWRSRRPRRSPSSAAAPRAGIEPIPANIYTHKTLSGSLRR